MNWIITPAFCRWELLADMLCHTHQDPLPKDTVHVVLDNHYPINKSENRSQIYELCEEYGCLYIDSKGDFGLHRSVNNAMKRLGMTKDDQFIGLDPDDRVSPGALQVLIEVMQKDKTFAVLGTSFKMVFDRMDSGFVYGYEKIAGHDILVHPNTDVWNVCAWNMEWLLSIGGLKQRHAYYFGLEETMYGEWFLRGLKFGYLADYTSDYVPVDRMNPSLFDREYGLWKCDHIKGFEGSFEEWLGTRSRTIRQTA